ncbi:MAG TPA: hypothetical protein VND99_05755 [Candidatus Acidoferrales bacterium]|nr:hypothetical protein [Candidatus Acidoferrales bacterium]
MLKEVIQSFLGVILALAGIFVLYLFITSLNQNANYLFFGGSLLLIGGAIFLFIRAEKSDTIILKRTEPESEGIGIPFIPKINKRQSETLAKNNEMLKEWNKTNATRDKLKIVQIASTPIDDSQK